MIGVFTNHDDPSVRPVVELLKQKGYDVASFSVDHMAKGRVLFSCTIDNGKTLFSYDKKELDMDTIAAAWIWHPKIRYEHPHHRHAASIEREMRKTLQGVWDGIEVDRWINHPSRIRETQNKIPQQLSAARVGLRVGKTVMTNSWDYVDKLSEKTIIKMPCIGIIDAPKPVGMYTTILDKEDRRKLSEHPPFPGMHQPFISKKREWRITIVGEKVFPVAIYTQQDAKDDWRKHQHENGKVIFKSEPLPDKTIENKCKSLLNKLGLRYGAFDFIETPDGEMIFLEVNSAGQYGWLEDQLGLPISEAIADLLIEIADRNR